MGRLVRMQSGMNRCSQAAVHSGPAARERCPPSLGAVSVSRHCAEQESRTAVALTQSLAVVTCIAMRKECSAFASTEHMISQLRKNTAVAVAVPAACAKYVAVSELARPRGRGPKKTLRLDIRCTTRMLRGRILRTTWTRRFTNRADLPTWTFRFTELQETGGWKLFDVCCRRAEGRPSTPPTRCRCLHFENACVSRPDGHIPVRRQYSRISPPLLPMNHDRHCQLRTDGNQSPIL